MKDFMPNGTTVVCADLEAPLQFLRTAFDSGDWVALLLKRYDTAEVVQRVGPVAMFQRPRVQAWLRMMNARRFNVYVSVNAIRPGLRTRTRDAIGAVRHVFIDADKNGPAVVDRIAARSDVPSPSYVVHTSPGRVHILWRARGFTNAAVERLQRHLADEVGGDLAATPCTQTTRLPGFLNHKSDPATSVPVTYTDVRRVYAPHDFPRSNEITEPPPAPSIRVSGVAGDAVTRARRYLAAMPPAVTGRHGDLATFQACCRVARGFLLNDEDALRALREWNARCEPPWTERELAQKVRHARRYGREPLGHLLRPSVRSHPWKP
jgi:hypothetical protein